MYASHGEEGMEIKQNGAERNFTSKHKSSLLHKHLS